MKRATILLALFLGLSVPAMAKDMNGKFGLGLDVSTGGVSGLAFRYFIGNLKLNLALGVNAFIPSDGGKTQFGFFGAPGLIYEFALAPQTNMGVRLKANLGYLNKAANNGVSVFEANIEIPIEVEYFFSRHFAMNFSVSLLFDIVPKGGRALSNKGASKQDVINKDSLVTAQNTSSPSLKGFGISFGAGSLIAGAGFTFYF